MMNPAISIIIPAFNTVDYIYQSIASVLDQTLTNLEVIVVNDASTDNTLEMINSFEDKRLKVFTNSHNIGAAGSRNRALQAATGEWIAVLDSDDWYAPERLEELLKIAQDVEADMVADDLYLIREGESAPWSTLIRESGESITNLKRINPVYFVETDVYGQKGLHLGISKPLFRRRFLIENNIIYDPKISVTQDFWLTLQCLAMGAKFYLEPTPYYYYRSRQGSLVYSPKLKVLEQNRNATIDFIRNHQNIIDLSLIEALSRNLSVLERNLAYYRVVEPLKQKHFLKALQAMVGNPYFFVHFVGKIPGVINRRIQKYVLKNETTNDLFPRSTSERPKIANALESKRN
jgi:succinoglycan biosynthesis protein ExoO